MAVICDVHAGDRNSDQVRGRSFLHKPKTFVTIQSHNEAKEARNEVVNTPLLLTRAVSLQGQIGFQMKHLFVFTSLTPGRD